MDTTLFQDVTTGLQAIASDYNSILKIVFVLVVMNGTIFLIIRNALKTVAKRHEDKF